MTDHHIKKVKMLIILQQAIRREVVVDPSTTIRREVNLLYKYYILGNKKYNNTSGIYPKRRVAQIDILTNTIINKFNSIREAKDITGIGHISCVCRGKRKSAGGYYWRYLD